MSPACSEPDLDRMGGEALLAVLDTLLESSPETSPQAPGVPTEGGSRVPAVKAGRAEKFRIDGCGREPASSIPAAEVKQVNELEGYPCELGTPEVVGGSRRLPEPGLGADCSRTDWSCQGHLLTVEMQCHYRQT
jgi:hypothetical protein